MKLEDLKKKMSELDNALGNCDSRKKIDLKASKTAKSKLMYKIRIIIISGLIFGALYAILITTGYTPSRTTHGFNIALVIFILMAEVWYGLIYYKLIKLNIETITPVKLISTSARIRLMLIGGDMTLCVVFVILMLSLLPIDGDTLWIITVALGIGCYNGVRKTWPEYMKLFREMTREEQ